MKDLYTKNQMISYSDVDHTGYLGLLGTSKYIQDCLTEFLAKMGAGNNVLRQLNNAAWVLTKLKIQMGQDMPYWLSRMTIHTYAVKKSPVKLKLQSIALDEKNRVAFVGYQEFCVIDLDTRKIRKIETTNFPSSTETGPVYGDNSFEILVPDHTDQDLVRTREVLWTDIDFSEHTNNTRYLQYLLDSCPADFFTGHRITRAEIHFLAESREKDLLDIYRKSGENYLDFLIRKGDSDIVKARMRFEEMEEKGKQIPSDARYFP